MTPEECLRKVLGLLEGAAMQGVNHHHPSVKTSLHVAIHEAVEAARAAEREAIERALRAVQNHHGANLVRARSMSPSTDTPCHAEESK